MPPSRKIERDIGLIRVLKALERGRMSGYELIAALSFRSGGGGLPAGHGEMYAVLYLLEAKGLVRGEWESIKGGRRRRYYQLTGRGHRRIARAAASFIAAGRLATPVCDLLGASPAECLWEGVPA